MALEAEIKIPVNDLETVIKRLKQEGFQETEVCREEDTYFNSLYYDMKEKDKALRIRRSRNMQTGEEMGSAELQRSKIRSDFHGKKRTGNRDPGAGNHRRNLKRTGI